jgi:hypothetical protein
MKLAKEKDDEMKDEEGKIVHIKRRKKRNKGTKESCVKKSERII